MYIFQVEVKILWRYNALEKML